jgi:hypothetical protein
LITTTKLVFHEMQKKFACSQPERQSVFKRDLKQVAKHLEIRRCSF